jgi:hypothetical protein
MNCAVSRNVAAPSAEPVGVEDPSLALTAVNRRSGHSRGAPPLLRALNCPRATLTCGDGWMQIVGLFVFFVVVLNTIAIGLCSIVERYSEFASLLAFLGCFIGNFIIAWHISLYLTERFLLTDAQKEANERHMRMLKGGVR